MAGFMRFFRRRSPTAVELLAIDYAALAAVFQTNEVSWRIWLARSRRHHEFQLEIIKRCQENLAEATKPPTPDERKRITIA
jgi:hypothetical protein